MNIARNEAVRCLRRLSLRVDVIVEHSMEEELDGNWLSSAAPPCLCCAGTKMKASSKHSIVQCCPVVDGRGESLWLCGSA